MSGSKNLDTHLFICTNSKDGKSSCAKKGSVELRDKVKKICKENDDWHHRIRVNTAGCLGRCEEGIAAVFYPQNKWLTGLCEDDAKTLKKEISEILK